MKRSIVPILMLCMLSGCGSASDGLNFKAPAGWTSPMPSFLGFGHMQMWLKKASDNKQDQILMLVRGQTTTTIDLKTLPQSGLGTLRARKTSTITICGNEKAEYLSAIGTGHSGQTQAMEMVSAPVGNQSYLTMYLRPQSDPADPAAEAALRSLCPAKT